MNRPKPYPGAPRWVRISGAVLIALILLAVVGILTGHHGLSRHMPGGHAMPSMDGNK